MFAAVLDYETMDEVATLDATGKDTDVKSAFESAAVQLRCLEEVLRRKVNAAKVHLVIQVSGSTVMYDFSAVNNENGPHDANKALTAGKVILKDCLGDTLDLSFLTVRCMKKLMPLIKNVLGVPRTRPYPWPNRALQSWHLLNRHGPFLVPGSKGFSLTVGIESLSLSVRYSKEWRDAIKKACSMLTGQATGKYLQKSIPSLGPNAATFKAKKKVSKSSKSANSVVDKGLSPVPCDPSQMNKAHSTQTKDNAFSVLPNKKQKIKHNPQCLTKAVKLSNPHSTFLKDSYVLENVLGDGNCLFYSLMAGLNNLGMVQKRQLRTQEMVIMPICESMHWFLAILYTQKRLVLIYDSLGCHRGETGRKIAKWGWITFGRRQTEIEWSIRHFHSTGGQSENSLNLQANSTDCGVFMCKAAEALALSSQPSIRQDDVFYVRRRMCLELLSELPVRLHDTRLRILRSGKN